MSRQAPLSLVELSDAVRALQLDSKNRGEQCDEAKRLSQDAHQRMGELRKRIDKLELRCERLEESFKKGVGVQLAKLQDDMSRAQSDIAALHGSVSTVRQAQERSEYVLRQAAEDSVNAYEMDPHYIKAYLRAAEAHLALNERATVKLAVQELQEALKRDEDNAKIKALLRDAELTWEADFD